MDTAAFFRQKKAFFILNTTSQSILNRFLAWAEAQEDVRTVLMIGSQAREDHPADSWSDVDLVVAVRATRPFLESSDWYEQLGEVWVSHLEPTALGDVIERRVMFADASDFDFVIVRESDLPLHIQHPQIIGMIRRGMRVLLDKDRMMFRITLPIPRPQQYQPPTEAEYLNVVSDFWYHAAWTAKKLLRGEVWTAKACCDGYMKRLLLRMMEWHTHTVLPGSSDTWFNGRFLEEWGDRRALDQLRDTFARYDNDDVRRALVETMQLFRWLAKETATQLTYPYPVWGDEQVTQWVYEQLGVRE